jgi:hypothetical protein
MHRRFAGSVPRTLPGLPLVLRRRRGCWRGCAELHRGCDGRLLVDVNDDTVTNFHVSIVRDTDAVTTGWPPD